MERKNVFEGAKLGDKFALNMPIEGELPYVVYLGKRECLFGSNEGKTIYDLGGQIIETGEPTGLICLEDGSILTYEFESYKVISKYVKPIVEENLDELAEEYYDSEIYQPSQAVFENGKLIKCADVDDNGEPYLSEWSIIQAYKAGYHKAMEE